MLFSGVNSLQILAYLAAVRNISGDPIGYFEDAYDELTNSTNQVSAIQLRSVLVTRRCFSTMRTCTI